MYNSPYNISNTYDKHPYNQYEQTDNFFNNMPNNIHNNMSNNIHNNMSNNIHNNMSNNKMNRDEIQFPNALPSNINYPIHNIDYNFTDRQFKNDRKTNDKLPSQNEYLHKYQINKIQQIHTQKQELEQATVNRLMDKKLPQDGNQMQRNFDDAMLFNRENPIIMRNDFIPTPQDTRKVKTLLDDQREPMSKVLGAPPKYNQSRNL